MINLDELEGVCDAMIEEGLDWCPPAGCGSAVQVKELIGMLREAQKDVARYRWLRDVADGFQVHGCMQLNGEEWDAKIDKVMAYEAS